MELLMQKVESIKNVIDIAPNQLPKEAGVYAFWWTGSCQELLESNTCIVLKGSGGKPVTVEYKDWWPSDLSYPCLYVGRSTNIQQRFDLHILRNKKERLHDIPKTYEKQKLNTTSCQLRYGIEHIFNNDKNPMDIINNKVGFSYCTNLNIEDRFYTENRLIGVWKPWFNVDSER